MARKRRLEFHPIAGIFGLLDRGRGRGGRAPDAAGWSILAKSRSLSVI